MSNTIYPRHVPGSSAWREGVRFEKPSKAITLPKDGDGRALIKRIDGWAAEHPDCVIPKIGTIVDMRRRKASPQVWEVEYEVELQEEDVAVFQELIKAMADPAIALLRTSTASAVPDRARDLRPKQAPAPQQVQAAPLPENVNKRKRSRGVRSAPTGKAQSGTGHGDGAATEVQPTQQQQQAQASPARQNEPAPRRSPRKRGTARKSVDARPSAEEIGSVDNTRKTPNKLEMILTMSSQLLAPQLALGVHTGNTIGHNIGHVVNEGVAGEGQPSRSQTGRAETPSTSVSSSVQALAGDGDHGSNGISESTSCGATTSVTVVDDDDDEVIFIARQLEQDREKSVYIPDAGAAVRATVRASVDAATDDGDERRLKEMEKAHLKLYNAAVQADEVTTPELLPRAVASPPPSSPSSATASTGSVPPRGETPVVRRLVEHRLLSCNIRGEQSRPVYQSTSPATSFPIPMDENGLSEGVYWSCMDGLAGKYQQYRPPQTFDDPLSANALGLSANGLGLTANVLHPSPEYMRTLRERRKADNPLATVVPLRPPRQSIELPSIRASFPEFFPAPRAAPVPSPPQASPIASDEGHSGQRRKRVRSSASPPPRKRVKWADVVGIGADEQWELS